MFCWESSVAWRGLLALSPEYFKKSEKYRHCEWDTERPPYQMTNKGLKVEPVLLPTKNAENEFFMLLNCIEADSSTSACVAVRVVISGGAERRYAIRKVRGKRWIEHFKSMKFSSDPTLVRRELYFQQDWRYSFTGRLQ